MSWKALLPITVGALLAAAPAAPAATFTVTSTQDTGVGVGCEALACPSIRAALISAARSPGVDTINVPEGGYHLSSGELYLDTPVEIVGAGARKTIVYGNTDGFRVLEVAQGWGASISGVTLRDGLANDVNGGGFFAGGVILNSGTLTLDRVRITGGHASSGGGLANTAGTVTITRSLIDNNFSTIGGGDSGGILNFNGGTVTVRDSTLASNVARGGGAYHSWGDLSTPNVATFERVTVTGNTAAASASGGLSRAAGDTLRLRATIVAGNTFNGEPSNCSTTMTSDGANLEDATDCGLTGPGDRQQTSPGFAAPGPVNRGGDTDVVELAPGSPAVDVVPGCSGSDQRGMVRPQGIACDAGAFEFDQAPETAVEGEAPPYALTASEPGSTFECSLDGGPFAACASPWSPSGLAPGPHTLTVRAVDATGNLDPSPVSRSFAVASAPAPAQPTLTPTPSPTPTPTPTPVANQSVAAKPIGTVRVRCRAATASSILFRR